MGSHLDTPAGSSRSTHSPAPELLLAVVERGGWAGDRLRRKGSVSSRHSGELVTGRSALWAARFTVTTPPGVHTNTPVSRHAHEDRHANARAEAAARYTAAPGLDRSRASSSSSAQRRDRICSATHVSRCSLVVFILVGCSCFGDRGTDLRRSGVMAPGRLLSEDALKHGLDGVGAGPCVSGLVGPFVQQNAADHQAPAYSLMGRCPSAVSGTSSRQMGLRPGARTPGA